MDALLRPWPESRSPEVHARRAPRRPGVGNSAAPAMIMTTLLRLVFAVALGGLFTLAPASAARSPSSNPAELPQACDVDRDAQSCLKQAIRLYEGKTLPKDDATARRFAAEACAEGAAEGCNFLAAMLEKGIGGRSEEHTSELQSLMRISYA